MPITDKKNLALTLKDEVERYAEALLKLRNTEADAANREDRVYVQDQSLPGFGNLIVSGGARLDKSGQLQNMGIRQFESSSSVTTELVVRTVRGKTSIMKKTFSPLVSNRARVAKAVFTREGRVLRYQESEKRLSA